MNYDELSFLNHQLAGMLKSGIPLEGALRQLASTMRKGTLRSELEQLEADLAKGTPMPEALRSRRLPDLYVRLLGIGARGNDLPSMLNLLGDYYTRLGSLWVRLKGLMVYPAIILIAATAVSIAISWLIQLIADELAVMNAPVPRLGTLVLWIMPLFLLALLIVSLVACSVTPWRKFLSWRLPGFKEAGLAQLASTLAVLLRAGSSFRDAIDLLIDLEAPGPVREELVRWRNRLAEGRRGFDELARDSKIIPPLFTWLVAGSGEDWTEGFQHAAEIYQARMIYRVDLMLYSALPVMTLFLGAVMLVQAYFVVQAFLRIMFWF
jgi:type II secretory pathway component PulF